MCFSSYCLPCTSYRVRQIFEPSRCPELESKNKVQGSEFSGRKRKKRTHKKNPFRTTTHPLKNADYPQCFHQFAQLDILLVWYVQANLSNCNITHLMGQWVHESLKNHALSACRCVVLYLRLIRGYWFVGSHPESQKNVRDAWFLLSNASMSTHWAIRRVSRRLDFWSESTCMSYSPP